MAHRLTGLIRLARPEQWIKNTFVFVALIFSGKLLHLPALINALAACGAFCLASSSVYFINDFKDIKEDKQHPRKKNRPLAAGLLPPWIGVAGFVMLFLAAVSTAHLTLGPVPAAIIGCYVIINLGYSLGLKHIAIIDVLLISTGFVLRILTGAAAIGEMPSTWLLVCAVTLSLFLGFTKRQSELRSMGQNAQSHRKVLGQYTDEFLSQAISVVTAATFVCYILYTVDEQTVAVTGSRIMILSVPFVLYGIFRYLFIVHSDTASGDPTKDVFTDTPMLVNGALWTIFCATVILAGHRLPVFF